MGMNTQVTGKALAQDGGLCWLDCPDGRIAVPGLATVGAEVTFVIGADRIRLLSPGETAPVGHPAVPGRVVGIEFFGSTQTIFVAADTGRDYRLQRLDLGDDAALTPGETVTLTWDPRHAWVLPNP